MKNWPGLAALFWAALFLGAIRPTIAAGQSSNSSGPTGTGPRVDVQVSPNGTLDIGGARGADLDLTGENFRGSFGASRSQGGTGSNPALSAPGLPGNGRNPFGAPNFGPSLPGGLPHASEDVLRTLDDEAGVSGLILPRFRRGQARNAMPSGDTRPVADGWRYQFFRGRWWYWQPAQSWVYWDGWQWQSYLSRN